jgi:flagellin
MVLNAATNTPAATAHRYLTINNNAASSSLGKLSSGSRIVKASDDAASLAVGTKLMADVTALKQAAVNASHGSSLLQVADGGAARIADILQRMKALSVQSQSGSVSDNERAFLDAEYQQLLGQVTDIATQTRFNGMVLLDCSFAALSFQVGVDSADTIDVTIDDVTAATLGVATAIDTAANAVTAGGELDTAIASVNSARASLGALMSRFEFVEANLATSIENLDAARATLMDVDMAAEMTRFTSAQVLTQAGVAMLAQANQLPQNLLRLFG